MTALWIILILLGILLLLPVGVRVRYHEDGLLVKAVLGPIRLQLYPGKKRSQKKKEPKTANKKNEKTEKQPDDSEKKSGGTLKGLKPYIPAAKYALQGIRRRLVLRKLTLYVTLGGDDPCDVALACGSANAAVAAAMPLLERAFRMKQRDIRIGCDFLSEETTVYADGEITACLGRLLGLAAGLGIKILAVMMKKEKAV